MFSSKFNSVFLFQGLFWILRGGNTELYYLDVLEETGCPRRVSSLCWSDGLSQCFSSPQTWRRWEGSHRSSALYWERTPINTKIDHNHIKLIQSIRPRGGGCLPRVLGLGCSRTGSLSPALGAEALPRWVSIIPTGVLAEQLLLSNSDSSLLVCPHCEAFSLLRPPARQSIILSTTHDLQYSCTYMKSPVPISLFDIILMSK